LLIVVHSLLEIGNLFQKKFMLRIYKLLDDYLKILLVSLWEMEATHSLISQINHIMFLMEMECFMGFVSLI